MFVVDAIGDNIVGAYSCIDIVTAFYAESNFSLCLSNLVGERTLSIGKVCDALTVVPSKYKLVYDRV